MTRILRLTKEEFVRRSVISHPEAVFDYSNTVINGSKGSATIVCPKGHKFSQFINIHMRGGECPYCNGCLMNTQTFKEKAVKAHPDVKYDYSEVEYVKSNKKVCITCPVGHKFLQTPNAHLDGAGCRKCSDIAAGIRMRKSQEDFISESKAAHPVSFDYSKAVYITDSDKVELTCPNGHHMWQKAGHHLKGVGCSKCTPYGYSKDRPGSIYLLGSEDILKIGITNRPVETRVREINKSSLKNFAVLFSEKFEDGSVPYAIEYAMKYYLRATAKAIQERFDGFTECFTEADQDHLIRVLKQHSINLQGISC